MLSTGALRLSIVNPNTTVSMTDKLVTAARTAASGPVRLTGYTSQSGPAAIQGREDGRAALPGLFEAVHRAVADGTDGIAIGCVDDTGLAAVRRMVDVPVVGIGEAAYKMAAMAGHRFTVVTTLAVSVPILQENITRYGLASFCAGVRASGVPVLNLEAQGDAAASSISEVVRHAVANDNCTAIVLGCAGMADLPDRLAEAHAVPILDGGRAATAMLQSFNRLGIRPTAP